MPFRTPVEPQFLPDVQKAFHAAAEFAYSLGVKRSNVRLLSYKTFLETISKGDDASYDPIHAIRFWREIHEITWVISALKESNVVPPPGLLVSSLDGRALEEYEHESGRNTFLELRAAIYFTRVGYAVNFETECDIVAVRKRTRIFIECKRLYSEAKASKRVRECYKQLGTRLAAADRRFNNLGLAWIDPSPAIQKRHFMYSAYSEAGLRHAARNDLAYFWTEWVARFLGKVDKRIFASVLQMISPGWSGHSGIVRTGFTSYVVPGHRKIGFLGLWKARRLLDEIWMAEDDDEAD